MKIVAKPVLALTTFVSLGTLGLTFAFVGAALPELSKEFDVSIGWISLIPAIVQICYAPLCFVGGVIADLVNKRTILIMGCGAIAVGSALVGVFEPFWINLLLFGVAGLGCGTVFISSNLLVVELFPDNPGSFLNIHHLVFALCSFVAPIIMSRGISSGAGWQIPFRGLALLSAILGIILFLHSYRPPEATVNRSVGRWKTRLVALRSRNATFVIFLTFFTIGTQFSLMFLLTAYLVGARNYSVTAASAVLSAFYILLATGRIACSIIVRKVANRTILATLLGLLVLFLAATLVASDRSAGWFLALSGLACSGLYPSILAMAGEITQATSRGIVMGSLSMAGGIGGMIITQITAATSETVGISNGFWIVWIIAGGTLVYFLLLGRKVTPATH